MAEFQEGNPLKNNNINELKNDGEDIKVPAGLNPIVAKRIAEDEAERRRLEAETEEKSPHDKTTDIHTPSGGLDTTVKKYELEQLVVKLNEQFKTISKYLEKYGQDILSIQSWQTTIENRLARIEQNLGIDSSIHKKFGNELDVRTPSEK